MRDYRGAFVALRQLDTLQSLAQGSNLIDLDQDRIRNRELDSLLQKLCVRDKKIVTDKLNSLADPVSQSFPTVPIVFSHAVFDRDNRILAGPVFPERNHLIARQSATIGFLEDICRAVVKLAGRRIERQQNI